MRNPEQALRALYELGASELAHLHGDLATHLLGTYRRLRHWENSEAVCLAGLFHAVYGTYGFGEKLLGLECREDIAKIIGEDAEHLVYVYAACDRPYFYPRLRQEKSPSYRDRFSDAIYTPDEPLLKGFSEITIANEIDVASPDLAEYVEKYGQYVLRLFTSSRFHALLSPGAREECCKYFPIEQR